MKTKARVFLTLLLCLTMITGATAAGGVNASPGAAISVTLDGKPVDTLGNAPYLDNANRVMVPVRFIAEALGAEVKWDDSTNTAKFIMGDNVVLAAIGDRNLIVNNKVTVMDTEAVIYNNRTYAPIRFIAEAFGITVGWDDASQTVVLSKPPVSSAKPSAVKYYPEHITAIDFGDFTGLVMLDAETANDDGSNTYPYAWQVDKYGNHYELDEFKEKFLKPYVQALIDDGVDDIYITDDGFYVCEGKGVSIVIIYDYIVEGVVTIDVKDMPGYDGGPAASDTTASATSKPASKPARTSAPKPTATPKATPVPTPAPIKGFLMPLIASGSVSAKITGNSIDYTTVELTNTASQEITVTIPIGTYFNSNSGSVQNMAVREPKTATLKPGENTTLSIKTACMNISRDIPDTGSGFSAMTISNSKLERVLSLCYERDASYAVTQAAVWIVTDQPSDYTLLNTLTYNGGSAISSDDLATAKEIVGAAG